MLAINPSDILLNLCVEIISLSKFIVEILELVEVEHPAILDSHFLSDYFLSLGLHQSICDFVEHDLVINPFPIILILYHLLYRREIPI